MSEMPNELPEGGDSGGSGGFQPGRWPGEYPQELPVWQQAVATRIDPELVATIVRLNDRVHQLESAQLVARLGSAVTVEQASTAMRYGGGIGGPNELPEGGDTGGSGGGIRWPGEYPAELPIDRVVELESRLSNIESMLGALTKQIDVIAKRG